MMPLVPTQSFHEDIMTKKSNTGGIKVLRSAALPRIGTMPGTYPIAVRVEAIGTDWGLTRP